MPSRLRPGCVFVTLALLAGGCATPIRPSGGPVDSVPPRIIASSPEDGAVNVETDLLTIEFSERIDESTVSRVVTIAPAFETVPPVRMNGRELQIVFPDSLQPQTTYVITLGTELRDEHGVALQRPITMAFATGDALDKGRITGSLQNPASNQGVGGFEIFAYRLPAAFGLLDSLAVPPDSLKALFGGEDARFRLPDPRAVPPSYSTESSSDGSFQLDFLREGPYFVVALDDRNRNRRADTGERFAVPHQPVTLALADSLSDQSNRALELLVTERDTTAPQLRHARSISSKRIALSLDESVVLRSLSVSDWSLSDSVSGRTAPLAAIYRRPNTPAEIFLTTATEMAPTTYLLTSTDAVADSSGNVGEVSTHFIASASPDTLSIRFETFLPAPSPADSAFLLRPDARPGVRFNQPVDSLTMHRLVFAIGPEGPLRYSAESEDGVRYMLRLDTGLRSFRLEVRMPDSTYTQRYVVPGSDALGSISGRVLGNDGASVVVEAYPGVGPPFASATQPNGDFTVQRLPPGSYRLRLFIDLNNNGRWDGGSLSPFSSPEPLQWLPTSISVRARWEHELEAPVIF